MAGTEGQGRIAWSGEQGDLNAKLSNLVSHSFLSDYGTIRIRGIYYRKGTQVTATYTWE